MVPFPKIPMTKIQEHIRNINALRLDRSVRGWRLPSSKPTTIRIRIHCIVLVHGWMGNSKELSYLQSQLIQQGNAITNTNSTTTTNHDIASFLTYSSIINEGRTSDGVESGGQRLAYEINAWMQQLRQQIQEDEYYDNSSNDDSSVDILNDDRTQPPPLPNNSNQNINTNIQYDISLSLIGNSLGGLYARYAVRDIQFQGNISPSRRMTTHGGNIQISLSMLHPAVFVTTCTPHLGVGMDQSFIPHLPHWVQIMIAKGIGPTGRDLFRIPATTTTSTAVIVTNLTQSQPEKEPPTSRTTTARPTTNTPVFDIVQEMAFCDEFIQPLQNFYRRIALCNTFRTDLQVPCSTAAFLISPSSDVKSEYRDSNKTSNHFPELPYYQMSEWNDRVLNNTTNGKSCISLIVETAPNVTSRATANTSRSTHQQCTSNEIAYQLDGLGWMKIFCDTRPHLPYLSMPTLMNNVMTIFIQFVYAARRYLYNTILLFSSTASTKTNENYCIIPKETTPMTHSNHTTIRDHYFSTRDIWSRYIEDQYCDTKTYTDRQHHTRHRWYLPFGHTVVVANAKNEWYGRINAAGQPTMDQCAKIILYEILQSSANK